MNEAKLCSKSSGRSWADGLPDEEARIRSGRGCRQPVLEDSLSVYLVDIRFFVVLLKKIPFQHLFSVTEEFVRPNSGKTVRRPSVNIFVVKTGRL